eukprot:TRINITY_DN74522_c0_g1_i1.p1 TRINITY_DN74522_c0_g1~~TRINITY_DN74522_c0_g1_i1.p1  ORF type:complete len:253 (+),score=66.78 TRINITY_DN74522_c0_g1_i1:96-761(+)
MRCVVQRVTEAAVTVGDNVISEVGRGMCVLVGISNTSTRSQIPWMAKKLLSLRIFEGEEGKQWAKNVVDTEGSILLVSQFTLCHVLKGAKPDFHNAMTAADSGPFFDEFVEAVRAAYKADRVKTGEFGAYMQVKIQNDGPVTLVVDAPEVAEKAKPAPKQQKQKEKKSPKPVAAAPDGSAKAPGDEAEGEVAPGASDAAEKPPAEPSAVQEEGAQVEGGQA